MHFLQSRKMATMINWTTKTTRPMGKRFGKTKSPKTPRIVTLLNDKNALLLIAGALLVIVSGLSLLERLL